MITGELKSKIDKLWEEFWTGGITNPLTVIEQISYLVFLRMIDTRESAFEREADADADAGAAVPSCLVGCVLFAFDRCAFLE